ncbi:alpha/beta fold hydrolase, partial [Bradyrhizobium sp. Arg68]
MNASRAGSEIERRFVATRLGRIHVAEAGAGFPVLLLHQTPRSWDEYRDVLPLLGRDFRAIAMDTLGFGDSDRPADPPSIELWAQGALALLDALELPRAAIVGHHTGAAIA